MQYVDQFPLNQLTLRIWSGTGEYTLYEDDGCSFNYKKAAWATTTYKVYTEAQQTVVEIAARKGEWIPPARQVIVELVGIGEQSFDD